MHTFVFILDFSEHLKGAFYSKAFYSVDINWQNNPANEIATFLKGSLKAEPCLECVLSQN